MTCISPGGAAPRGGGAQLIQPIQITSMQMFDVINTRNEDEEYVNSVTSRQSINLNEFIHYILYHV